MEDVTVGTLDPLDAAALLPLLREVQSLHVAAHPETFRSDLDADGLTTSLRGWLERDGIAAIVARDGSNAVVGYAIWEVQERGAEMLTKARRRGFIHHLAVKEACRGRGVGTRLVAEVKARLRAAGIHKLGAEHLAANRASAALMHKTGLLPRSVVVEGET